MIGESDVLMQFAVEAEAVDRGALCAALDRLAGHDPRLLVEYEPESGQTLIGADREEALAAAAGMLRLELGEKIRIGAPQAAYRETVAQSAEVDHCYKRQSGGSGAFARILIAVEPIDPAEGLRITNAAPEDCLPPAYARATETGITDAAAGGPLGGFPLAGVAVTIRSGAFHDIDSSAAAFEIAGREALREAVRKAGVVLLEPVMTLVVLSASADQAAVQRLVESRRGAISEERISDSAVILIASAPLARLFGFEAALAGISDGRAQAVMRFLRYAPLGHEAGPDDSFPAAAALRA
jgi:elongation factor G